MLKTAHFPLTVLEDLSTSALYVRALNGTDMMAINAVTSSTPDEDTTADDDAMVSFIAGNSVTMVNGKDLHGAAKDDIAHRYGQTIAKSLAMVRNAILPTIEEIYQEAQKEAARINKLDLPYFEIEMVADPIVTMDDLAIRVEDYQAMGRLLGSWPANDTILLDSIDTSLLLQGLGKSKPRIEAAIQNLDGISLTLRYAEENIGAGLDVYWDGIAAGYYIVDGLIKGYAPEVSDNLKRGDLISLRQSLGFKLNTLCENWVQRSAADDFIIKYNTNQKTAKVYGSIYNNWMAKSEVNSVEALNGFLSSLKPGTFDSIPESQRMRLDNELLLKQYTESFNARLKSVEINKKANSDTAHLRAIRNVLFDNEFVIEHYPDPTARQTAIDGYFQRNIFKSNELLVYIKSIYLELGKVPSLPAAIIDEMAALDTVEDMTPSELAVAAVIGTATRSLVSQTVVSEFHKVYNVTRPSTENQSNAKFLTYVTVANIMALVERICDDLFGKELARPKFDLGYVLERALLNAIHTRNEQLKY